MLCDVQKNLVTLIKSANKESLVGAAYCAREIKEIEIYKRELRGKPRLKAIDAALMLRNAAARVRRPAPMELEVMATTSGEPKHSFETTVTAPPTPTPPSANE
jgi:hypothetical protein